MYTRDLNGCAGDRMRVGITAGFNVSGEKFNGRKIIDLGTERVFCEHKIYLMLQ